jgi:hypothetical protein
MDRQSNFDRGSTGTHILRYILNILVLLLFKAAQMPNIINCAVIKFL